MFDVDLGRLEFCNSTPSAEHGKLEFACKNTTLAEVNSRNRRLDLGQTGLAGAACESRMSDAQTELGFESGKRRSGLESPTNQPLD